MSHCRMRSKLATRGEPKFWLLILDQARIFESERGLFTEILQLDR